MRLNQARCMLTESANNSFTVTVEANTTLADVMAPEFFANVAVQMRPYDKITVRTDDGMWYAELLVLTAGRTWVKTKLLLEVKLTTQDVDMTEADKIENYEVKHRGPHLKFCVIRKSDNEPIREQFDSKEEANGWLASFVRA